MAKHRTELINFRDQYDEQAMKVVKLEIELQTKENICESKLNDL